MKSFDHGSFRVPCPHKNSGRLLDLEQSVEGVEVEEPSASTLLPFSRAGHIGI